MDDRKEIRKKLWHSLDMSLHRRSMILVAVVCILPLLLYRRDPEIGAVMIGIIFVSLWSAELWQIWKIYRHAESYHFCRTKLTVFHNTRYPRGFFYFTVVAEDRNGKKIPVNTEPIFQSWGIGALLEDYVDETVTIGYNEETYQVVVIE